MADVPLIIRKCGQILSKYRFLLLILLVGIALMLWPSEKKTETAESGEGSYSLTSVEEELTEILRHIHGVGRVQVMLTLKSGTTLQLASDDDISIRKEDDERSSQTVKLNRSGGGQEVVVTQRVYPTYRGAVVVCDGADNSSVCLSVIDAVAVLTGLSSDRITVLKWQS